MVLIRGVPAGARRCCTDGAPFRVFAARFRRSAALLLSIPIRPVLKHGPRSLACARVIGSTKPKGEMKVKERLSVLRGDGRAFMPTRNPGASIPLEERRT